MNSCSNCSRSISTEQRKVLCSECNQPIHLECLGISIDDAKRLTRSTSKCIRICCNKCLTNENKLDSLMNLVLGISDKLENFENRLSKMESQLQKGVGLSNERNFEDCVQEAVLRNKKLNNLIAVGLPESAGENSMAKDMDAALDIIKKIEPTANIKSTLRLGKPQHKGPRLLQITLGSNDDVRTILRNKNKLANTKYSKIRLRTDQTKHQLEYLKNVRNELQQRQENGESVTIKYIQNLPTIVPLDQVSKN